MKRPLLLIASRRASVSTAIQQYINLFMTSSELHHRVQSLGYSHSAELFERLDEFPPEQLREMMVLFDIEEGDEYWWDIPNMGGESGLAAQLILSYPEIYFVFLGATGPLEKILRSNVSLNQTIINQHHCLSLKNLDAVFSLIRLHAQGFRTIFDPTGLRSALKLNLQQQLLEKLPGIRAAIYKFFSIKRTQSAAAIADEEANFLYLNGYAAYKFGSRAWLAHTKKEFSRLFGDTSKSSSGFVIPKPFKTAILDWHLAYRDDDPSANEPLAIRENAIQSSKIEQTIVLTSFPAAVNKFLDEHKDFCRSSIIVMPKPYGSFFDLLKPPSQNGHNLAGDEYQNMLAQVEKYLKENGPESPQQGNKGVTMLHPHSAPYASGVVAERLLSRAWMMKANDPYETVTWIQIAILAGEAKEILGGLSRTIAYEAIALQYEAEVSAEVSFYGMSAKIEVKQRLEELENEVENSQRASRGLTYKEPPEDQKSRVNCLLKVVNDLRLRFSQYEQIDAAEECLYKVAEYDRSLNAKRKNLLYKLGVWYVDSATRAGTSVQRLLLVSLCWIAVFAVAYFLLLQYNNDKSWIDRFFLAVWHSLFTYFQFQPGLSEFEEIVSEINRQGHVIWVNLYRLILLLELVLAYLHLGLLVSVLYRRMTRRAP